MRTRVEEKILRKLDKIEGLLVQIVPQRAELTEDDALKIIEKGNRELREGRTKVLHSLKDLND